MKVSLYWLSSVYLTVVSSQRLSPEEDSKETHVSSNNNNSLSTQVSQIVSGLKVCSSNADCHIDLNERCITSFLPYMTCGCGQAFTRNKQSNVCELKRGVRMVFRFDSLAFLPEYSKKTTPGFIRMKELTESTLGSLVNSSSQLTDCVKDIQVVSFQKGNDELTNEASLEAEALIYITNSLYQAVKSRKKSLALVIVKEISVLVHQLNSSRFATNPEFDVVATQIDADVDPCFVDDLNYCSPNSLCFFALNDNRYSCSCKDRFTDLSPHPRFPGEICSLECPDDYCSNDGYCHVDKAYSRLYCTCNHWNIGSRCQYSGIIVFSVLGVIVLLLLLVVGCTTAAFCGRRETIADSSDISRRRLMQPKASLLSSCPEDHSSRPFRITIDNLNYASDTTSHMTPVIQFSPNSLVQQSSRESCDFSAQHQGHHAHHILPQVIHHPPSERDTEMNTPVQHNSHTSVPQIIQTHHPTPSPRPSLSSTIGVQTDNVREVVLTPASFHEVSLDKSPRGLRVVQNDKVYAEGVPKESDSVQVSWC